LSPLRDRTPDIPRKVEAGRTNDLYVYMYEDKMKMKMNEQMEGLREREEKSERARSCY
jgi:hypothetical protein